MRGGRGLVREVEGLGIIFRGEGDHLLAGDFIMAETGFRTDFDIFEILHHRSRHFTNMSGKGVSSPSRPVPGGKPIRSRISGAMSTLSKGGSLPAGLIAGPLAMN